MNYANPEISSKLLNAAKNSCTQLIESTAEMVGILDFLREVSEDTGMPLDEDVLFECEQISSPSTVFSTNSRAASSTRR